jgi:hypothetical protein
MEKFVYQLELDDILVIDDECFTLVSIRNDGGSQGYFIRCKDSRGRFRKDPFRFDRDDKVTVK